MDKYYEYWNSGLDPQSVCTRYEVSNENSQITWKFFIPFFYRLIKLSTVGKYFDCKTQHPIQDKRLKSFVTILIEEKMISIFVLLYFRVVYGPDLVMLGPDEHFTKQSLSGGKPKKPNMIKSLCLLLGPDFCTDIVIVETSDHARLSLQLSYNW